MTELLNDVDAPSDAELISRVRGGDAGAYGELFSRHVSAANRLARQLVRGPDADDLVAEAFAKVLSVLQSGGGPDVAFRAYLLTAVRRLHVDRVRAGAKLQTTDDLTPFDPGIPFQDTAVAGFESGAAAKAFASLPERWQLVLWHLEVEGQKPADIAPLLGMSPNSVSALAYRAREGLRQAFLTMHLADISETECRWVNEHLGAYVRNGLSKRDSGKLQTHLDACRRCTAMYLELTEVNSDLSAIIAPLLLGAAATGYVASTGGVSTAGVLSLFSRAKDVVLANTGAATAAGAVAAGVAVATVVGITLATSHPKDATATADKPVGTVSTAPAAPAPPNPTRASAKKHAVPPVSQALAAAPNALASPAGVYPTATASALPTLLPVAAANPVAPAPAPTSAAPTPAGPTQPVTTPAQPTTQPPTQPSTPPATQPPPPTETTPPPAPLVDVTVGAQIDDTSATVTLHSDSTLPTTFDVQLHSTVAGVGFAGGGDCTVLSSDVAQCSTLNLTAGNAAEAAAPTDFVATLPLAIPADQPDTSLSVSVSFPKGYAAETTGLQSYRYIAWSAPTLEAHALSGQTVDEQGNNTYDVDTGLSDVPAGSTATFTVDSPGAAVFSATDQPKSCSVLTPQELSCTDPADLTLRVIRSQVVPAPVTLSVIDVAPGYRGRASAETEPLKPGVDLGLTLLSNSVSAGDGNTYHLPATVSATPQSYAGGVTLTVAPSSVAFVDPAPGCSAKGATLTCDKLPGLIDLALSHAAAPDPSAPVTATVTVHPMDSNYVEVNPSDNSGDVTLLPSSGPPPSADVFLTNPDPNPVPAEGNGTYRLTVKASGFPPNSPDARYTIGGGASIVSGSAPDNPNSVCKVQDDGALVCTHPTDGPVQLVLQREHSSADTDITVHLDPVTGYVDGNPNNNTTAPVTLKALPTPTPKPVDLSLKVTPHLDGNSGKRTVDVAVDGAPASPVVLTATFNPDELTVSVPHGCLVHAGTVTCTSTGPAVPMRTFDVALIDRPHASGSSSVTFHVEAPGFTDSDPADNTSDVTVTRHLGGSKR